MKTRSEGFDNMKRTLGLPTHQLDLEPSAGTLIVITNSLSPSDSSSTCGEWKHIIKFSNYMQTAKEGTITNLMQKTIPH